MFKKRRINGDEARAIITSYSQVPIEFCDVDLTHAIEIAGEQNMYAYDSYMLECALSTGAPLLTLDVELRAQAGQLGILVVEV
jgi:predicted nucleic acid-binding protein